jgi:hypothetical protein
MYLRNSHPRNVAKKTEILCLHKDLDMNVYGIVSHSHPKLEQSKRPSPGEWTKCHIPAHCIIEY